jgi:hypothetical protein
VDMEFLFDMMHILGSLGFSEGSIRAAHASGKLTPQHLKSWIADLDNRCIRGINRETIRNNKPSQEQELRNALNKQNLCNTTDVYPTYGLD